MPTCIAPQRLAAGALATATPPRIASAPAAPTPHARRRTGTRRRTCSVHASPSSIRGARAAAAADGGSMHGSGQSLAAYRPDLLQGGQAGQVDIAIEPGPSNSRCIWGGVDIAAPPPAVYAALTSYEALGTFIPGLAENRCLERFPDGCRLLQVGRQELGLGFQFRARVCLRIREHPAGMPARLLARAPGPGGGARGAAAWWPFGSGGGASSSGGEGGEARFLLPRSPLGCAAPMDVSFELEEGDFADFTGLWRVQGDGAACRLSYSLLVRPQPWLLVGLIEQRVGDEIAANLAAVRAHVEAQMAAGARPSQ